MNRRCRCSSAAKWNRIAARPLAGDQLVIHYQPLMELNAAWKRTKPSCAGITHKRHGFTGRLHSIAGSSGIVPIGNWVGTVLQAGSTLQKKLSVAVNGLPPSSSPASWLMWSPLHLKYDLLRLELLESRSLENPLKLDVLKSLKELGVVIALMTSAPDIQASAISTVSQSTRSRLTAPSSRTRVEQGHELVGPQSVGHSLGLTLAEGIETKEQPDTILRALAAKAPGQDPCLPPP